MDDSSRAAAQPDRKSNLKPNDPLVALVLFLVPLMMLILALPPYRGNAGMHKVDYALSGALVTALIAGIVWWRTSSTLPLILLGVSLLLVANICWGKAFRQYTSKHNYSGEVFRKPIQQSLHAPLYGRYDNAFTRPATLPFALLSGVIAAGWYFWSRRRGWEQPWNAKALAMLMAFQLAMIIAFAACEPWPSRFSLNISGYDEFKKDIPAFAGVNDTLRNYVAKMPNLQWYGQHYPPGNLVLLEIEKESGLTGLTKSIVCLCTILSVLPLLRLTRELDFDPTATSGTLFLFAAGSSVLIYCTINTTSLLLLPGTMCLWLLVRALKTGSLLPAAWLGCWFVVYLFFSFSASVLGVLMALTTLIGLCNGAFTLRNVIRTSVASVVILGASLGLLYLVWHFNLVACFISAVRGHHANEGFDDPKRWLLRSTGNLIAYVFSIVPLCVLAIGGVKSAKPQAAQAMLIAVLASVVIASFSGLFYIETERIWIFLTPVFALAAGWELSRRARHEASDLLATIFLLVLLISCSQEWLFMHYR